MDKKIRNGYYVVYLPEHRQAKAYPKLFGWIYEHRVIAEEFMGRPLRDDEEVHHLDENKLNNHPENLLVLTCSQHLKLHGWMRRMGIDPTSYPTRVCKHCEKVLSVGLVNYCSKPCADIGTRKRPRPDKEQLEADILVMPMVRIGIKYGVSDNSVRKWCKYYGIDVPKRYIRVSTGSGASVTIQTQ